MTGVKGPVHSQIAAKDNTYNQNFRNRFCGCGEVYDAHTEKGTMFQCLGLAGETEGGCGEDWWHPECVLGLGRSWSRKKKNEFPLEATHDHLSNDTEETAEENRQGEHADEELPPGFPTEDEFETFVCYKCVDANPWIKRYASSTGFLSPVLHTDKETSNGHAEPVNAEPLEEGGSKEDRNGECTDDKSKNQTLASLSESNLESRPPSTSLKRRAEEDGEEESEIPVQPKKIRLETNPHCYYERLPEARPESLSLFLKEGFRDHFCRCGNCYPNLREHPQLLEEEESYEPPLSEEDENVRGSVGTGSLLDRGEAALNNVDRVRAIGMPPPLLRNRLRN